MVISLVLGASTSNDARQPDISRKSIGAEGTIKPYCYSSVFDLSFQAVLGVERKSFFHRLASRDLGKRFDHLMFETTPVHLAALQEILIRYDRFRRGTEPDPMCTSTNVNLYSGALPAIVQTNTCFPYHH
jgi:hypothetical protein